MADASWIDWQPAHAGHAFALQQFTCTDPARRLYERHRGSHHPKPWELAVQSHVRERRPPLPVGEAMLLAFEGAGLVGVSHFGFDTQGEEFIIFALARAEGHQGRGIGDALLASTINFLQQKKAADGLAAGVFTRIHERNSPSQALFARAGFSFVKSLPHDLELWGRDL